MVALERSRAARLALALLLTATCALGAAQTLDPKLYSGLVWRNIGPFRAGRVSAVTGVIGQPGTYYMGLPLGGVWKTTSAGVTWYPIFDQIKEASCVGAIEVAPSDPNVIYVGMGDLITGGGINEGNGVYKSTDAGKTWQHMGLEATKQIPSILVDPKDPNLVIVAAQGNIRKQSDDRGLYRSTDGGKTWTKTLFVDNQTGIQKITWATDNPDVMLATTVRHYNAGGGSGGFGGAAGGTKLFKSTDKGLTWKELTEGGLPALSGRTCIAIANGTNSQRMFIVGNWGLYRSDDGGASWKQMAASDRRVANGQGGYNCGVYVNPKNPDVVYVFNTCSYISRDGGNTFTGFKGAPGGDDPQQMWLDPTDGNRLFMGMDQGATVSLDGGQTWSTWYNQSTAQVYHISVDNQFPYWVYATEQDSGSIATRSRGDLGAITPLDWLPTPAYEFGSIVPDPLNPKIVYAGGPGGGIVKITYPSGQWINVSPNVESKLNLRKVGNQPLLWSKTNPRELFAGFQYLMSTTDGGMHWKKVSPDLGYPKGVTPPASTPTPAGRSGALMSREEEEELEHEEGEQRGQGQGGAIESIGPSSVSGNVIWVGTNNGLIKLTKDHGKTWEDATIPSLPARSVISAIDASHHDAATAYAAVDHHGSGDLTPSFYRTRDYGKTWTKIVDGLPTGLASGSFSRVIRADTKRQGLLFAGTESFVYVSFDDGDHWQSLALNLPNTSYRDMVIKDNDLVVGTYGRGFWVLDDISPLRQIAAGTKDESARLFKPGDAVRVRRNINSDTPFPPEVPHALNPPVGAIIYYYLGAKPSKDITIEISDSTGRVVRHMSSAPIAPLNEPPPPVPDFWIEKPQPLPLEIGTNRINWDLRCDNPPAFSHSYGINANPGLTPMSPEGPLVPPGVYTVALSVDGETYKETVKVVNDPRSPAKLADLKAQYALQMKLYDCAKVAWDNYHEVAKLRAAAAEAAKSNPAPELAEAVSAFDTKLAAVGGSGGGGRRFGGGGGGGPTAPTFAGLTGTLVRQLDLLDSGDMAPNESLTKASLAACAEFDKVVASWKDVQTKDLPAFNAVLAKYSLKPIAVASVQVPSNK
jgi:photosystem II stability/assembly factor-like uncharacterized protein